MIRINSIEKQTQCSLGLIKSQRHFKLSNASSSDRSRLYPANPRSCTKGVLSAVRQVEKSVFVLIVVVQFAHAHAERDQTDFNPVRHETIPRSADIISETDFVTTNIPLIIDAAVSEHTEIITTLENSKK